MKTRITLELRSSNETPQSYQNVYKYKHGEPFPRSESEMKLRVLRHQNWVSQTWLLVSMKSLGTLTKGTVVKTWWVLHCMSERWIFLGRPRKVLLVLGKSIRNTSVRIWFHRVSSKVAWTYKLFVIVSCPFGAILGSLGTNMVWLLMYRIFI